MKKCPKRDERGFVAAQATPLLVATILLITWFISVMMVQYARASIHAALYDAAREASTYQASGKVLTPGECATIARQKLRDYVPGMMKTGSEIMNISCHQNPSRTQWIAQADTNIHSLGITGIRFVPVPGSEGQVKARVSCRPDPNNLDPNGNPQCL